MKHVNYLVLFLLFFAFIPQKSIGQEQLGCGLHLKLNELYSKYPGLEADQAALLERSKHYSASGDREAVYTIPVVFHIIHENGVENISDAQVFDQLEILNRDFRKLNADTSEIMDEFAGIAADTQIEFRLANIDPFGNCTNGIEHIYSHETNIGDDNSKLNQWPRSRYLNVWVVRTMEAGTAGYAYYPSAVSTSLQFADGIIIRHDYIGRIGTGSEYNSRALTHEIGHWLGLPHVWGSTNEPGVACGDDGIEDTPITAGHTSCLLVGTDYCNPGTAENIQNYMEYSYCSRMYTSDQKDVMNLTLDSPISNRNNLHTEANKINCGIVGGPTLCSPLPDFYTNIDVVCPGNPIQYFASVQRAEVVSYNWTFPGGTPATSTEISPIVTYEEPGVYDAILSVTNAAGTEVETKLGFAHVLGDYWLYEGPHSENFENDNFNSKDWFVFDPEFNDVSWKLIDHAGKSGNTCIGLEYFIAEPDPLLLPNYYQRQGGSKDIVVSPSFNLDNTTDAALSFSYIYATNNGGLFDGERMSLKIYYRKGCSDTWSLMENLDNSELITVGYFGDAFYPTASDNWQTVYVNLPAGAYDKGVRFKFEFTAPDFLNNFFIDDFNISGVLSTDENNLAIQSAELYPNPSTRGQEITLSYFAPIVEPMDVIIYDLLGNVVFVETIQSNVGVNKFNISLPTTLIASGVYNVVLKSENSLITKRLILN